MFSSRLPAELTPNALSDTLARLRASGAPLLDLTETNPTAVGLPYPDDVPALLADGRAERYAPHALGLPAARRAVAAACSGSCVSPDQIVLSASTSEAYAFLFKLLCDPGDNVLVPRPSYPLFDLLSRLEGVEAAAYHLDWRDDWAIDRASVERALTSRTRALLLVNPNNPTGSRLRASDREWLVELAAECDLALISDEVFADYPLSPRAGAVSLLGEARVLTFTLGGLSKSAGLPQMKLAWTVVDGPPEIRARALERLEIIADTYLSVSTPVQVAAAPLLDAGARIRRVIASRLRQNLDCLRSTLRSYAALTLFEPEGGWSAVLRIPAVASEEEIVLRVLREAQVLVHPGYFFDFSEEAFVVVSLLPDPDVFRAGVSRLAALVAGPTS